MIYKNHGEETLNSVAPLNFENVCKAIEIVKKEIINDELLDQLEDYFFQFTIPSQTIS